MIFHSYVSLPEGNRFPVFTFGVSGANITASAPAHSGWLWWPGKAKFGMSLSQFWDGPCGEFHVFWKMAVLIRTFFYFRIPLQFYCFSFPNLSKKTSPLKCQLFSQAHPQVISGRLNVHWIRLSSPQGAGHPLADSFAPRRICSAGVTTRQRRFWMNSVALDVFVKWPLGKNGEIGATRATSNHNFGTLLTE